MGNCCIIGGNNSNFYFGSGKELAKRSSSRCSDFSDSKKSRDIPDSLFVNGDGEFKLEKVNSTKQNSSRDREGLHIRPKTRSPNLKVDLDNTNVKIAESENDETKPLKASYPSGSISSIASRVSRALFSCIKPTTEQEDSSRTRDVEGVGNLGYVPEASCQPQDENITDPIDDSYIEYRDKKVNSTSEVLCKHSAEKASISVAEKEKFLQKQKTVHEEFSNTASEVQLGSPRMMLPNSAQTSSSLSCPETGWTRRDVRNKTNSAADEKSSVHSETIKNAEYSNKRLVEINASLFSDKTPSNGNNDGTSREKLPVIDLNHESHVSDPEKSQNDIAIAEFKKQSDGETVADNTETHPASHKIKTESDSPSSCQAASRTPGSDLNIIFSESTKPWKYPTQVKEMLAKALKFLLPNILEYGDPLQIRYLKVEKQEPVCLPFLTGNLDAYEQRQDNFLYEEYRRQSFDTYTGNGNVNNLARNGFYHNADECPTSTMCYFCRISKGDWDPDTNIEEEHKRLSPDCPVHREIVSGNVPVLESSQANATVPVREIPAPDQPNNHTGSTTRSYATTGGAEFLGNSGAVRRSLPTNSRDETEDDGSIDIESTDPGNMPYNSLALNPVSLKGTRLKQTPSAADVFAESPSFQDREAMNIRAGSFRGWPDYLDQTPQLMAKAGFFFVGTADKVQCFHCGGGLRNWERGDDPFIEHARWFPSCIYMTQIKGAEYVAEVQRCLEIYLQKKQEERRLRAQMRDEANMQRDSACLRCRQVSANTALLPCGHLVVCDGCAGEVTQCPQCNGGIENRPES